MGGVVGWYNAKAPIRHWLERQNYRYIHFKQGMKYALEWPGDKKLVSKELWDKVFAVYLKHKELTSG